MEVVSSIMARGTIHDLFSDVLEKLGRFVHFDRLVLLLSDEAAGTVTLSEVCSTRRITRRSDWCTGWRKVPPERLSGHSSGSTSPTSRPIAVTRT